METDLAVECDGLTVDYGEIRAVDDLCFGVLEGEIFGLIGPNGAGKTSVIRALTTIIEPTAGRISINGISLRDQLHVRRCIGVLPESNGYPNDQSAFGYLRFYGQLFGLSRDEAGRRAGELLDLFGLEPNRHDLIKTFSRGMRQRLGIARALVNRPRVMFLDEPTLGLDPAGKDDILRYLASAAAAETTTVVLCSHLLDEVERICDRVAILHEGRLRSLGTVDEVVAEAGVASSARLLTAPRSVAEAVTTLEQSPLVAKVSAMPGRRGEIAVDLANATDSANDLAALLVSNGVPIHSLELRGARLADAFLSLTGASGPPEGS